MNIIIKGASGFMGLFDTGAETFVSWVSGIVPKVLLLLILMNTIIALIGQERVNKFAKLCSGNVILAYGVLPFISAFMLGNPMALSMGKFLPERMKPSYYGIIVPFRTIVNRFRAFLQKKSCGFSPHPKILRPFALSCGNWL